ncbi:pentapeptide repeat protein [Candidatus Vecturithrix granuli]|uniref:Pentapeptide repeat protein n=1 Tax=Vecturithrix granuli TaxID=1499967 RepID=A0A081C6W3_VECG1|nr:pentapeptide repeat protein [Candidatus Vecturithrix granuli]
MAHQKYFSYLKNGVTLWNHWRENHPHEIPDLREINLEGANLEGANFKDTNLAGANLRWANLKRVDFTNANLSHAECMMADCSMACFVGANLSNADFRGAILVHAKLQEAKLVQTNLSQTNVTGANFYDTARDGWNIEGSLCEYVFWDWSKEHRIPQHGYFRPGEFEKRYKNSHTPHHPLRAMLHLVTLMFNRVSLVE